MMGFPEFSIFFKEPYSHDPFPWQRMLAERLVDGEWPRRALDLPTALAIWRVSPSPSPCSRNKGMGNLRISQCAGNRRKSDHFYSHDRLETGEE